MTDIAHLLPCPFCAGRPQIDETEDGGSFIECAKCGAASAVHYDRMENLIPSWNRRALEAEIERLRAALEEIEMASFPLERESVRVWCVPIGAWDNAMRALEAKDD